MSLDPNDPATWANAPSNAEQLRTFLSPTQNPWGVFWGGVIAAAGGLAFKRVRVAIARRWRAWRDARSGNRRLIETLATQVGALIEQNAMLLADIAELRDAVSQLRGEAAAIKHQLYPNSGGSFFDRVTRDAAVTWKLLEQQFTEGVFIADPDGNVTYTNAHLQRWLGKRAIELVGRGLAACIALADQARYKADQHDAVGNGIELRGLYPMRFVSAAGTGHKVLTAWLVTPVRDPEDEKIVAWHGSIRPATDTDQADARSREATFAQFTRLDAE
jgi:PAS domain-containing protein